MFDACVRCRDLGLAAGTNPATDWHNGRVPIRNGLSAETGLLKQWQPSGPPVVWSVSTLAALRVGGDQRRSHFRAGREGWSERRVLAQPRRWERHLVEGARIGRDQRSRIGSAWDATIDGDRVYVLTENGNLACLKVADGAEVWRKNILSEFNGRQIPWLISESPLIDGGNVIVTPGGPRAGMVALDKMTGKTVWTSQQLSDEAGYASPIAADVQGVRVYMTLTSSAGVGVRASDGKLMWRFQPVANGTANVATPVFHDNRVFYTSNYGTGAGCSDSPRRTAR